MGTYNVLVHVKTFVDNYHPVTHKTRIKIKLSLQVQNSCNIQNVNQSNISRPGPNRVYTKIRIKINHKCKLRSACNRINAHQRNKAVEN